MEMKKIVSDARKRRAKLLAEYERTGWTVQKLADKHGMTRARMGQLLKKAKEERDGI